LLYSRLTDSGEIVSLTHRPYFTSQEDNLVLISVSVSRLRPIARLGGLRKLKKDAFTPSGIDPATFPLVAQCLDQLRYDVPYM
jgi:hypothetical protein